MSLEWLLKNIRCSLITFRGHSGHGFLFESRVQILEISKPYKISKFWSDPCATGTIQDSISTKFHATPSFMKHPLIAPHDSPLSPDVCYKATLAEALTISIIELSTTR